jgi:hypothetical protein
VVTLFHGTGQQDATLMQGPPGQINVTIGGGEFGRGFYTQHSERKAREWARKLAARLNGPPVVLRLDIDDAAYGALNIFYLNAQRGLNLTEILDFWHAKDVFTTGCCDVIEGPIAGDAQRIQQKFESNDAQDLLNGNQTIRTVR